VQTAKMQLKEFSLFVPNVESGTVLKALETAIPSSAIEQAISNAHPRYLLERVYFLLTRRPFFSEKSGLLIETPTQILDLEAYPEENREDVHTYIQQYISATPSFFKNAGWINNNFISKQEFCQQLTVHSENRISSLSISSSHIKGVVAKRLFIYFGRGR